MRAIDRSQKGLTLVEVLVAMLVLATAVATFLSLMSQQAASTHAVRENVLGRIAAENAMVTVLLAEERNRRETGGEVILGGVSYEWEADRSPAPIEGLQILTVSVVKRDDDRVLASLETLRPAEVAAP